MSRMSKMLEILSGEIHQIEARRQAIVDQFLFDNNGLGLEVIDLEAQSDMSLAEFISSVSMLSLFNSTKLIVVKHLSTRADFRDNIKSILQAPTDRVHLIIIEPKLDLKTNFGKCLKKHPALQEYKSLTGFQLQQWLCQRARSYSTQITPQVADYLINKTGGDMIGLDTELQKLQVYTEITKDLVDSLVIAQPSDQSFQLLRALFSGHLNQTLDIYNNQLIQKNHPLNILGSIVWQLQNIVVLKSHSQPASKTAQLFKMHKFVAEKSQILAKLVSWKQLNKLIELCQLTDKHIKVHFMQPEIAVEYLIIKSCHVIRFS